MLVEGSEPAHVLEVPRGDDQLRRPPRLGDADRAGRVDERERDVLGRERLPLDPVEGDDRERRERAGRLDLGLARQSGEDDHVGVLRHALQSA